MSYYFILKHFISHNSKHLTDISQLPLQNMHYSYFTEEKIDSEGSIRANNFPKFTKP